MRIKEIDHVQLAMPPGKDSEARSFYEGVLGIPEVPKLANLEKRDGCWFVRGSLKILLGVDNDFRAAHKAHPVLLVEDLAAHKALIEAAGYSFNTDEPLAAYDRIYVKIPLEIESNSRSQSQIDLLPGWVVAEEKRGGGCIIPKVPGTLLPCWLSDQSQRTDWQAAPRIA
jgi:hypothetical protein